MNESSLEEKHAYRVIKRGLDLICSFLLLILLSPVFVLVAVGIKLTSKGPVFYRQHRIGYKGHVLYIYKFRSMVENADCLIETFSPKQKEEYFQNYKLEHDPRITRIGHILRKTSLDELPQLLNILKGEMSFVGPRPIVEAELEKYGENKSKFLSAKPGLTGYWAANGRSTTSYDERMQLELYYVDHASLLLDIKIFFKTFCVILSHEGAY